MVRLNGAGEVFGVMGKGGEGGLGESIVADANGNYKNKAGSFHEPEL
jgi:hypothetical protein